MFDTDEMIEKWGSIGLLDGLSDQLKRIAALKYEIVAVYLLDKGLDINNVMLSCIFPIIYRIYRSGKNINDVESFINDVHIFIINNRDNIDDLRVHDIDVEAHLVQLFLEKYKSKVNMEPSKLIIKHKL